MILTKCISSLPEKRIKIPVEGLSYDITLRHISSLMSFSYIAELVLRKTYVKCKILDVFFYILY